ncbi:AbrB/MazE/SpoVT family DNA-binding domain-containing protein [Candidatus Parcubacteria bacterium]|nr:AbrB/MazE/SpoVT family DNA-binding domain-containing protein [Patescibacteria group bacterium]MCG2686529.1 AbrB/MazE/SpoVT family DNA-binding domain-containing protein [Candidatus Parcubacteria bacterium]
MQDKYIHKIRKVSTHSYAVTLPKQVVKDLKWREKQKIEIVYDKARKRVIISDWEK